MTASWGELHCNLKELVLQLHRRSMWRGHPREHAHLGAADVHEAEQLVTKLTDPCIRLCDVVPDSGRVLGVGRVKRRQLELVLPAFGHALANSHRFCTGLCLEAVCQLRLDRTCIRSHELPDAGVAVPKVRAELSDAFVVAVLHITPLTKRESSACKNGTPLQARTVRNDSPRLSPRCMAMCRGPKSPCMCHAGDLPETRSSRVCWGANHVHKQHHNARTFCFKKVMQRLRPLVA